MADLKQTGTPMEQFIEFVKDSVHGLRSTNISAVMHPNTTLEIFGSWREIRRLIKKGHAEIIYSEDGYRSVIVSARPWTT